MKYDTNKRLTRVKGRGSPKKLTNIKIYNVNSMQQSPCLECCGTLCVKVLMLRFKEFSSLTIFFDWTFVLYLQCSSCVCGGMTLTQTKIHKKVLGWTHHQLITRKKRWWMSNKNITKVQVTNKKYLRKQVLYWPSWSVLFRSAER